jgi:Flp pilus assembly protein CpaB
VLTAARDLPAGAVLQREDVALTAFDPDSVPAGVLGARSVVGRTTTVPMRSGEPVTEVRVLATSLLDGFPGLVAVPVRIGDPGAVRLLQVGDRVDLLAANPQGQQPAEVVGHDVPLLAIPRLHEESPGLTNGALVVVGLPDDAARIVAQASVSRFLSVVLTH